MLRLAVFFGVTSESLPEPKKHFEQVQRKTKKTFIGSLTRHFPRREERHLHSKAVPTNSLG